MMVLWLSKSKSWQILFCMHNMYYNTNANRDRKMMIIQTITLRYESQPSRSNSKMPL